MAFDRVAGDHGANTPAVDGLTVAWVEVVQAALKLVLEHREVFAVDPTEIQAAPGAAQSSVDSRWQVGRDAAPDEDQAGAAVHRHEGRAQFAEAAAEGLLPMADHGPRSPTQPMVHRPHGGYRGTSYERFER